MLFNLNKKTLQAVEFIPVTLTADAVSGASIAPGVVSVVVSGVANGANDWIVLPAVADVPVGHSITIAANAGSNFELRTPATSNTKINNVDSDGTQEYLVTDTDTVVVTKNSATTWIGVSYTNLGAVRTAVIPD